MSKINVNNIEANDASTDITVTTGGSQSLLVDTDGKLTVAGNLSVNGNNYPSAGALSNRNLIINGAMQVAQRGTSVTGLTSTGYRACDRFIPAFSSLGTWTVSQSTDAPEGFANSYKLECTTADASPAAADYVFFDHRIEGQNLQHLKKGTANALPVTLSFWVKSNKTGNFQTNLNDADNGRAIASVVTINTADTWEYKTITFAGDTTGTLDSDNDTSLRVEMWLDVGTNWSSGATPTAWEPLVSADRAAGTDLGLGDSTSNYWQITGVQLEAGDSATPFEHRSYGDELARCERYFEIQDTGDQTFPLVRSSDASTGAPQGGIVFRTTKRAAPTITFSATSGGGSLLPSNLAKGAANVSGAQLTSATAIASGASTYLRYKAEIEAEL